MKKDRLLKNRLGASTWTADGVFFLSAFTKKTRLWYPTYLIII